MLNWIRGLFTPVNDVLNTLDVSGNDKRRLENAFAEIQANLYTQAIELEKAKLDAHAKVVQAESQHASWVGRNWRPIASCGLLTICVLSTFDLFAIKDELWDLSMWIIVGHGASRGIEKTAAIVKLKK